MPLPQLTADDVERALSSAGEDDRFQRLCNALIWAYAGRSRAAVTAGFTEREKAKDLGADAVIETAGEENGLGPLLASGLNVFQYKRRDAVAGRTKVLANLKTDLAAELARVAVRSRQSVASYTLFTSLHLSRTQTIALQKAILKGSAADKTVVRVIGAADIAAMLNDLPHIRTALFGAPRFETWEAAWSRLAQTKLTGAHVELIGRKEEMERLSRLIDDAAIRVILVYGPHDVGKDRLILEATRGRQLDVLVAAEPEAPDRQEMQEIGGAGREALLIAQDVALESLADLIPRVLAQPALKLICSIPTGPKAVLPSYGFDERVQSFPLARLSEESSRELLRKAGAHFDFAMESWVVERAGGIPGILLAAASLSGELRDRLEDFWKAVGQAFQHRVRQELGQEALDCLKVLSVLTRVSQSEIEDLARALGRDPERVRAPLAELGAAGLVEKRGGFYEVQPAIFAEFLAAQAVAVDRLRLYQLVASVEAGARIRLFRRLSELPDNPELRAFWTELLGLFADVASLERTDYLLPILAEAAPALTLAALQKLLQPLSIEERKAIEGEIRGRLVDALRALLLRAETSARAARLLLLLAEAENEGYASSATGVFIGLFHPGHPQIAASLVDRKQLLAEALASQSPSAQLAAVKAARAAFQPSAMLLRRSPAFTPPEKPAVTYGELRQYAADVLELLIRTGSSTNAPAEVATAAQEAIPEVACAVSGIPREVDIEAFRRCLDWLRDEHCALKPGEVVRWLEVAIQCWEGLGTSGATRAEQGRQILAEIGKLGFARQVQRWTTETKLELRDETEQRLRDLAREAVREPRLLTAQLSGVVISEVRGWPFFVLLGEEDTNRVLLSIMEERSSSEAGLRAFGAYCHGRGKSDRAGLASYIEGIERQPISAEAKLYAANALAPDPKAAEVIRRAARENLVPPAVIWRIVASGDWLSALNSAELAELLEPLAGAACENAQVVINLLAMRAGIGQAIEGRLSELGWRCLEAAAASQVSPNDAWHFDRLAAALAAGEPDRGFALLRKLIEDSPVWNPLTDLLRPSFWPVLRNADRRRALETVFATDSYPIFGSFEEGVLDQEADGEILTEMALRSPASAAQVALALTFGRSGFWEVALPIAAHYTGNERVEEALDQTLLNFSWQGSATTEYEKRLQETERVLNDPNTPAGAKPWLRKLQTALRHDLKSEAVWEYDVDVRDLKRMVEDRSSPERLWAIGRILKHAKWEEVQKLLGPEDIEEALPLVDLPEKQKQALETALRYWLRRA
jgi:DNA-binding transcriptional ArsR family regulator